MGDTILTIIIVTTIGVYFLLQWYVLKLVKFSHVRFWLGASSLLGLLTSYINNDRVMESYFGMLMYGVLFIAIILLSKNHWAYYVIMTILAFQIPYVETSFYTYHSQSLFGGYIYFDFDCFYDIEPGSYLVLIVDKLSIQNGDHHQGVNVVSLIWMYLLYKLKSDKKK